MAVRSQVDLSNWRTRDELVGLGPLLLATQNERGFAKVGTVASHQTQRLENRLPLNEDLQTAT